MACHFYPGALGAVGSSQPGLPTTRELGGTAAEPLITNLPPASLLGRASWPFLNAAQGPEQVAQNPGGATEAAP